MLAGRTNAIAGWESKEFSNEKIKPPVTTNHRISAKLIWIQE